MGGRETSDFYLFATHPLLARSGILFPRADPTSRSFPTSSTPLSRNVFINGIALPPPFFFRFPSSILGSQAWRGSSRGPRVELASNFVFMFTSRIVYRDERANLPENLGKGNNLYSNIKKYMYIWNFFCRIINCIEYNWGRRNENAAR